MPRKELHWSKVLTYRKEKRSQATVVRFYKRWRQEQGIPIRCDVPECPSYSEPLIRFGKPVPLILDHVGGNHYDNRPGHLRLLCGLCDSQQR